MTSKPEDMISNYLVAGVESKCTLMFDSVNRSTPLDGLLFRRFFVRASKVF